MPLAPLHQPYNLAAIEAVRERLPDVPQVACFDTSFHRGQPEVAAIVPLPRDIRRGGVQRYGFHGLSYEYIASALPKVAPEIAAGRVIVAHLGSGASMCAMKEGQEHRQHARLHRARWPVHGHEARRGRSRRHPLSLPGARARPPRTSRRSSTRSPACSAFPGSATTCATCSRSDAPAARLAIDYFVYRAAKEIGALAAVLGGIDGLVFTAGIGENSAEIRQRICEASAWLGDRIDPDANARRTPSDLDRGQPRVGVGHSDERGTDDRPAHRRRCWACRGASLRSRTKEHCHGQRRQSPATIRLHEEPASRLGRLSIRPLAEGRSTSATSSSRTTSRTTATSPSSRRPPRGRKRIWDTLNALFVEERKKGVLDVSQIPSSITAHAPGYIDRENEIIVGLQTDAPLKRAIMPNGGFRLVVNALKAYGYEPDPQVVETFTKYRKTHNDAVFDAYTADVRRCRSSHMLTGLPDAYGRGRIIGDYRRVALYGVNRLIERKKEEKSGLDAAAVHRRDHPRPGGALRADPRARGAASRWPRATASTSRARREPRRKRSSGSTSATSPA